MKKLIAFLLTLVLCLGMVACGGTAPVEPTPVEPTPEPTPTPTPAPLYVNPLNGEVLDAPYSGRVFASTISNVPKAVPHVGVNDADIFMEMFVNGSIIRGLALYSDISKVEAFGGVRSTRPMFHDIIEHYDAVLLYSGAATSVLNELLRSGLDAFNIDIWGYRQQGMSYRDKDHDRVYENSLMGVGAKVAEIAAAEGTRMTTDRDYNLSFADEGTPAAGETANEVNVEFNFNGTRKETAMKYDAALDKYVYWQYQQEMRDQNSGEPEAFTNVIVMNTVITHPNGYHHADFNQGGDGVFACGGKLVPITWTCEGNTSAFKFFNADGSQLQLERGNTYIAIAPNGSTIRWS